MNNNFCPECGKPIMPNQNFCNYCGFSVNQNNVVNNNQTTGKLIINRNKKFYGFAVSLTIEINGYSYSLVNGGRLEFDLAPGVYNVTWKFWCRRDKSVQINVLPGNWYLVDFRPDYFWGGFKLTDRCKFY